MRGPTTFIFPQFPCGMARVSAAEKAGGGVAVALQHFRFNVVPKSQTIALGRFTAARIVGRYPARWMLSS